ncbi:MAG: helix-turn-helix domain-containing protein [Anaeroplasmataceae bacterium]|nr:helix-turn-helix domain-containing protein [Anaeroplasmataceae bacterium]
MDRIKMGKFLTELRKEKDLSQTDLAEIIGVTFQAVSKWERGEAIPDISILEKLASFYNVSIDEIIKGEALELKNENSISLESKKPRGFLNQKRIFGFWYSLAYLGVFFISGFCPFISSTYTDLYVNLSVTSNYYEVVFSSQFDLGNFLFLLQFLTTLGIIVCTLLYCTCKTKKTYRVLSITRLVLIILNLLSLSLNVSNFFDSLAGAGVYVMFVVILIFDILYLALKPNRNSYILQDFNN